MFCRKCGNQIENDSSFCKYCGTTMNSIIAPPGQGNVGGVNLDNYIVNNPNAVIYRMEDKQTARKKFSVIGVGIAILIALAIAFGVIMISVHTRNGFNLDKLGTVSKQGRDDVYDARYKQWNNVKYKDGKCKVYWHAFCVTSDIGYPKVGTLDIGFGQKCDVYMVTINEKTTFIYNNEKQKTCVEVDAKETLKFKDAKEFARKYLSFY